MRQYSKKFQTKFQFFEKKMLAFYLTFIEIYCLSEQEEGHIYYTPVI